MICQTCKQPIVGPARIIGPLTWHLTGAELLAELERLRARERIVNEPSPLPLGVCPRCHRELDNVGRGVSMVAGGLSVCTGCVNPGEIEIARARGL